MLFVSTSANAKYPFNACSIALTGNESLSNYLMPHKYRIV